MLVLSRKRHEAIIVRKDGVEIARVLVCEIEGYKVRIGLKGDESIQFVREEIAGTTKDKAPQKEPIEA